MSTTVETATDFRVDIPKEKIDDLRRRISATRWPTKELVDDRSQGVQLATLKALADYWTNDYDFGRDRGAPERAAAVHDRDRRRRDPLHPRPLAARGRAAADHDPRLARLGDRAAGLDRAAHRPDRARRQRRGRVPPRAAVHSRLRLLGRAHRARLGPWPVAQAWGQLMPSLGYTRYVAQGGDVGSQITDSMGRQAPEGLIGIHTNLLSPALAGSPMPGEHGGGKGRARGDRHLQGVRFRLLRRAGHAARDDRLRPAGLAHRPRGLDARPRHGQLLQDRRRLRGREADGQPHPRQHPRQHHDVLADGHRGLRGPVVLGERTGVGRRGKTPPPVTIPVGFTTFPGEIWRTPRSWAEAAYPTLTYFNEVDKGGHFAAWEEPELFATEVRATFRSVGKRRCDELDFDTHPEAPAPSPAAPNLPERVHRHVHQPVRRRRRRCACTRSSAATGPPLLLVHGWPQTWYAWRLLMPALAGTSRSIAVDQRGIGLSDKPADGYDTGTLAGDLVALMDALGHQRFAAVRHRHRHADRLRPGRRSPGPGRPPGRLPRRPLPGISPSPPLFLPAAAQRPALAPHLQPARRGERAARQRDGRTIFFGAEFAASAGTRSCPTTPSSTTSTPSPPTPKRCAAASRSYRAFPTPSIAQNEQRKTPAADHARPRRSAARRARGDGVAGDTMKLVADDVQSRGPPGSGHWVAEQAPEELLGGADRLPGPLPRARRPTSPCRSRAASPRFDGATGWLNSPALTPEELRGKVVLVDFWTTRASTGSARSPYVRAWARALRGATGSSSSASTRRSSRSSATTTTSRRAVEAMDVGYPVALDPDYAVWDAFANHYWPAAYIADAEGRSGTTTSARAPTTSRSG